MESTDFLKFLDPDDALSGTKITGVSIHKLKKAAPKGTALDLFKNVEELFL